MIARAVGAATGLRLAGDTVDSNIVIFEVTDSNKTAADVVDWLAEHHIKMLAISPQAVRAVTHLDVHTEQIETVCKVLSSA